MNTVQAMYFKYSTGNVFLIQYRQCILNTVKAMYFK